MKNEDDPDSFVSIFETGISQNTFPNSSEGFDSDPDTSGISED